MKLVNRIRLQMARLAAAWMLGVGAVPAAMAQSDPGDPPGRVGRLAELTGQVWLFTPESGEWVDAARNLPVTTGDRLSTDAGARAEVRIGSTTIRLDSGSELEFVRVDDERMSLHLHSGSVAARLRSREAADEFDLRTSEGDFTTQRAGRYRFDRTDGTSHLTVYTGQALYEGPRSALTVNSGQHAEFWIDAAGAAQYSITEPQQDAFSAWNNDRDRRDDRSVSARYVSPEMTGVEDLDRHGRWEQSVEYGPLWIPRGVASGWAPYSTGRWAWVRPWGWTWVDDAPWGFAPFHYGRWVWYRSAWCWAPGTYVARPVYAPALVAWVGGPSLSVSLSIGGGISGPAVGWFPLAPREVYVPGYRHSPRYVRQVNVTHVTNVNIINTPIGQRDFSNRKFPHAVTVVPTSVMTARQPVGPVSSQLRDAPAVREFVREQRHHGALQDAPVAAPVVVAQPVDPRPRSAPPGVVDSGRNPPPGLRAGRPEPRDGDTRRGAGPGAGNPVPAPTTIVGPPPTVARQPEPASRPPTAVIGAPSPSPSLPDRSGVPPRRERGEPVSRGDQPALGPAPTVRGGGRPEPVQGPRPAVSSPVAPVAAPAAPVVRTAPVDRGMPDKRHHAQPPVATPAAPAAPAVPRAVPAEGPERARARAEADQREDRRPQRERSQMVN